MLGVPAKKGLIQGARISGPGNQGKVAPPPQWALASSRHHLPILGLQEPPTNPPPPKARHFLPLSRCQSRDSVCVCVCVCVCVRACTHTNLPLYLPIDDSQHPQITDFA